MTKAPVVQIKGVSKAFRSPDPILHNVNLCLNPQEIVALIGPTGCGKSTLLRLIAGLDQPDTGSIYCAHDRIEMLFQDATLLPWRTLEQNVALPLELSSPVADRKTLVESAVARVGLQEHLTKYPHEMSGGMKMRTALARSLVSQAPVLMFDEPFASVDEITRTQLQLELLQLRAALNFSAIVVTHDISEAVFLADRIVVLQPYRPTVDSISSIIENVFEQPRDQNLRFTVPFTQQCQKVHSLLAENTRREK